MNVVTSVVCMGAHILDVLVRPVTDIPPGQETALAEQMRMTAAGTAAGTALTFAKLGAAVRTAGAIGTDPAGDVLLSLLDRAGIETGLVVRKPDVPTSMSVLPIRPNGERPSLHSAGGQPCLHARRRRLGCRRRRRPPPSRRRRVARSRIRGANSQARQGQRSQQRGQMKSRSVLAVTRVTSP